MNQYNFELRDYEGTKARHESRALKVKQSIKYADIFNQRTPLTIAEHIKNQTWYTWNIREDGRLAKWHESKAKTREVKTAVNAATRQYIIDKLKAEGLPKSWDTAVYIAYYNRVNAIMAKVMRILERDSRN